MFPFFVDASRLPISLAGDELCRGCAPRDGQTEISVEKPIASENRTPSLWASRGFVDAVQEVDAVFPFLLCEPDLTGEGMQVGHQRLVMTSRSRPSPFDMATSTAGVRCSWRSIIMRRAF